MKKLIILLIILSNTVALLSQNTIDPPRLFDKTDSQYDNVFKLERDQFILGWNWGSEGKGIDDLLDINFYHNVNFDNAPSGHIHSNSRIIKFLQDPQPQGGRLQNMVFNSQALHLEPTIIVDSSNNFRCRWGDDTHSVFGFQNRNFSVGDTVSSGANFSRFILDKSNISGGIPQLVLSNVWKKDFFYRLTYPKVNPNGTNNNGNTSLAKNNPDMNGKRMYLTINLRNLESIDLLGPNIDATILSIRVPYKLYIAPIKDENNEITTPGYFGDDGYAVFDSVPKATFNYLNDTLHIRGARGDFRGVKRKLTTPANSTTFNITPRMLHYIAGDANQDITLTALLIFNEDIVGQNPFLKSEHSPDVDDNDNIYELDMEVTYHGKLNIAIDWIRLQTPTANAIFEGKHDNYVLEAVENAIEACTDDRTDASIFGIYAADEPLPPQWASARYYNLLLDTMAVTEVKSDETPYIHFGLNTMYNVFWTGTGLRPENTVAVPFIKRGYKEPDGMGREQHLGYPFGYEGGEYAYETDPPESTPMPIDFNPYESDIDTYFRDDNGSTSYMPFRDPSVFEIKYPGNFIEVFSKQANLERKIHVGIYQNPHYLFDRVKPWFANIWTSNDGWFKTKNAYPATNYVYNTDGVPITGEDIKLNTGLPLILGTKGLFYYVKSSEGIEDTNTLAAGERVRISMQGLDQTTGMTGNLDMIASPALIGDYMNPTEAPWDGQYNEGLYDWDDLGPDRRVYLGMTSLRFELYKLHKYIRANEDELMNLELLAWQGKGFTKMYVQDSTVESNLISTSLDIRLLSTVLS